MSLTNCNLQTHRHSFFELLRMPAYLKWRYGHNARAKIEALTRGCDRKRPTNSLA